MGSAKTEGYEDTGINDLVPLCKREKKMKFGKPYML
jgi:hypothetical protein